MPDKIAISVDPGAPQLRSAGKCERKKSRIMSVSNYVIGRQETVVSIDTTPIECSLSDLREIRLKMVSGSSIEPLWNTLVREYHYLGHQRIFGRRLKYLAFADSRPIAALGWKTASIRLEA